MERREGKLPKTRYIEEILEEGGVKEDRVKNTKLEMEGDLREIDLRVDEHWYLSDNIYII